MTRSLGIHFTKPKSQRSGSNAHPNTTRGHDSRQSLSLALQNEIGAPFIENAWPTPTQSSSASRSFYLGSTSYASVSAQEQPLPNALHEQPPASAHGTATIMGSGLEGTRHCHMSVGKLIISKCEQFTFLERLVRRYFVINGGSAMIGPLITNALPQMCRDLKYIASHSNNPYPLLAGITKNSSLPLKVPPNMLPSKFHTLFTGASLRWEAIGLMMALAASCAQRYPANDPLFTLENGDRVNKDDFIINMLHATNDCITLCEVHGAVNDVVVWLLYNNMLIQNNWYGDNCMSSRPYLIWDTDAFRSRCMASHRRRYFNITRRRIPLRECSRKFFRGASVPARITQEDLRCCVSSRQRLGRLLWTSTDDAPAVQ